MTSGIRSPNETLRLPATRRPAAAARRFGYLVAMLVNAAGLVIVNRWPGWEAVPVLTADTRLVVGLVNASIAVSLAANLVYLVRDPDWLKAAGDVVTTSVALVALVRLWQVFPFDFGGDSVDWALIARVVLGLAIAGSAIGIVIRFAVFVKCVAARCRGDA